MDFLEISFSLVLLGLLWYGAGPVNSPIKNTGPLVAGGGATALNLRTPVIAQLDPHSKLVIDTDNGVGLKSYNHSINRSLTI